MNKSHRKVPRKSVVRVWMPVMLFLLALSMQAGCASKPNPDLNLGGIDLEEAFNGQISRIHQILGGINSMDSANKAKPQLEQVSLGLDDLIFNSQKLSPEGQTALSMLALREVPRMETLISQVNETPVIRKAISGSMQEILDKIKQLI